MMIRSTTFLCSALVLSVVGICTSLPLVAGPADVLNVKAECTAQRRCRFAVSVRHDDSGWDHYANRWEVLNPENRDIIATRVLHHPHEHEQPFTRSLNGVDIPEGLATVIVRAHDSVHGFGGKEQAVELSFE
jgi:hypothetical protein